MKKALLALLLVTGCSSGAEPEPLLSDYEFETKMAAALIYDPALLKVGDRVVYFVKRSGATQTQTYTWSAVSEEPGTVWIENKLPFDPRSMIVKTKFERTGKVVEQWIGEPGGLPGRTYPSPKGTTVEEPKPVRDTAAAKADSKELPERIIVGGRPYDCIRVTTSLVYPDGRKSTMVNWFSKEVPFAASSALGGMVKRQFGRLTMELVAGDRMGKSEMTIPPPSK
jgi:hypothetical protein